MKRKRLIPKKKRRKIIIGENEKIILLAIGAGVLLVGAMVFPSLPIALQPILKMRGQKGFMKLLRSLQNKGVINLGGDKVRLTSTGLKIQKELQLEQIIIERPKNWDGLWRLVSYDIPDIIKEKRDWFRQTLIRLGFRKIQESLWVYPFECKEEIAIIAEDIGVAPHVMVMMTDNLPNEEDWESDFNLNPDEA